MTVTFLVMTLNIDPLTSKFTGIVFLPSCIYVWIMKTVHWKYSSYCVRTKVLSKFSCDLDLWPFDHKMYRYLPLTILHLCVTYESCTLKIYQDIVSEPKCWQILVVTLTFDLLTQIVIGIFVSPSCIYEWNMKTVHWKLLKLSCQNQSVDGQIDRRTDRWTNLIPVGHLPSTGALTTEVLCNEQG